MIKIYLNYLFLSTTTCFLLYFCSLLFFMVQNYHCIGCFFRIPHKFLQHLRSQQSKSFVNSYILFSTDLHKMRLILLSQQTALICIHNPFLISCAISAGNITLVGQDNLHSVFISFTCYLIHPFTYLIKRFAVRNRIYQNYA